MKNLMINWGLLLNYLINYWKARIMHVIWCYMIWLWVNAGGHQNRWHMDVHSPKIYQHFGSGWVWQVPNHTHTSHDLGIVSRKQINNAGNYLRRQAQVSEHWHCAQKPLGLGTYLNPSDLSVDSPTSSLSILIYEYIWILILNQAAVYASEFWIFCWMQLDLFMFSCQVRRM